MSRGRRGWIGLAVALVVVTVTVGLGARRAGAVALPGAPLAPVVPAGTVPGSTVPGSTVPGSTVPGSTVPGSTVPGSTVPGSTVPGSTVPGSTVPGSTVPGSTVPGSTVPGTIAPVGPDAGTAESGTPGLGVPCLPVVGCDPAGQLAVAGARAAARATLDVFGQWVADGATALLSRVSDVITATTSVHLTDPGGSGPWFGREYEWMRSLGVFVVLPLVLVAAVAAVIRQDPGRLLRTVAVHLPLAILGTAVALELTDRALQLTDVLSNQVSSSLGADTHQAIDGVARALGVLVSATGPSAGGFVFTVAAMLVAFGALLVWLELLLRASAIYVAVLFLPLVLSGLVWPTTARWTRRLVETLVALILSKFVIVAVISLAAGAVAQASGLDAVLAGAALLLLAAFSPFVLLRLIPVVEAGAIAHLEGMERRPVAAVRRGASQAAGMVMGASGGGVGTAVGAAVGGLGGGDQPSDASGAPLPPAPPAGSGRPGSGDVGSGDVGSGGPDLGHAGLVAAGSGGAGSGGAGSGSAGSGGAGFGDPAAWTVGAGRGAMASGTAVVPGGEAGDPLRRVAGAEVASARLGIAAARVGGGGDRPST